MDYREPALNDDPAGLARRVEISQPLLRPGAAALLAVGAFAGAFVAFAGCLTGDAPSPLSRVAAFAVPVLLGGVPAAAIAPFLRRRVLRERAEDGSLRTARTNDHRLRILALVYLTFLASLGGLAARRLGISGPPPPPTIAR